MDTSTVTSSLIALWSLIYSATYRRLSPEELLELQRWLLW